MGGGGGGNGFNIAVQQNRRDVEANAEAVCPPGLQEDNDCDYQLSILCSWFW